MVLPSLTSFCVESGRRGEKEVRRGEERREEARRSEGGEGSEGSEKRWEEVRGNGKLYVCVTNVDKV